MSKEKTFKIIGIDPGSTTAGIATLEINKNFDIISIKTECIDAAKVKTTFSRNNNLEYRLKYMSDRLNILLSGDDIEAISIEMPFANPRRMGAVIPLARLLGIIMNISLSYSPYRLIHKISPSEVKNSVGAKGNADKDGVLEAILKIDEITNHIDLNMITEHEVDAIGVAKSLLDKMKHCYIISIL